MKKIMLMFAVGILVTANQVFAADSYTVDPVHSTVSFRVRHLGVSYVTGKFDKFDGKISFEGDTPVGLNGTVDAASINTANANRDGHLKSDDFLAADKFPAITFQSTEVAQSGDSISVTGNLTIRDVTKTIKLQGEFGGFADMGQVRKTGLVLEGEINRKDFGLLFNKLTEAGQIMVGDQVKLTLELEADKAAQ